ncbi:hypothetical protein PCL1606_31090 [Pseudomonas chlororaphis]|uniref:Uncharacterized protein n=1 Tax=Pseudomonas chlororaphis TaxID=587753 RepID=A0A0D5Y0H3_9PSED|nr:hypothetical protein PCL1606_31090 [Pseudomonas chlororaphis]
MVGAPVCTGPLAPIPEMLTSKVVTSSVMQRVNEHFCSFF